MSIAQAMLSRATFRIKRGLRFSHCYFPRTVHSAPKKVAFAPVQFSRCFGQCFRLVFRLALCTRTVCAVVHKSFALSALHGLHRARAHRSTCYTRSDTAPTFDMCVSGAIPRACPRVATRGDYDYSQGGHPKQHPLQGARYPARAVERLTVTRPTRCEGRLNSVRCPPCE